MKPRFWRHLNVFSCECLIECSLPRLKCLHCKQVWRVKAPWEGKCKGLSEEFEAFALTSSQLVSVASPEFRESLAKSVLMLEDLKGSVQIVVRDSSRHPRPQSFGYLAEGRHWYVTDHLTKKEIILAGMGWGRLHEHLIAEELRTGRLVPMSINNYTTKLEINMCVARMMSKPTGPVAATLWKDFREFANHRG